MKLSFHSLWTTCGISLGCLIPLSPVLAQIVPDETLPVNSIVTPHGITSVITGGTKAGSNLFHSFSQFSVPTNGIAYFNNALDIQNIVSRVTGLSVSNINGLIKANGAANLFLINPNGITFGSNAQLNIGGSFMASTANSLNFADGAHFSSTNSQSSPLLTVSVPIGLGFGSNPGPIRVQGTGNTLINPIYSPLIRLNNTPIGLSVPLGKTLALVGGDIAIDGGVLTAPGGRIELGSVGSGTVSLAPARDWTLGYEGVTSFKDIRLFNRALADASGNSGGSISVQGQQVSLSDGSAILIQNTGLQPSGGINVNSDSLTVNGTSPEGNIASTLLTENLGNGSGGDITISTKRVVVQDGGQILPRTFGLGTSGNLTVNASESVQVLGYAPKYPNLFSNISDATFGPGNAGNLILSTDNLIGLNGIQIGSATFGSGSGGDVMISASNITLNGVVPGFLTPSTINAATFKNGKAGEVTVDASNILLQDGGSIASSTTASGTAGSVTINASSVKIEGVGPNSITPSLVDSSALVLSPPLQQQLRLPPIPTGDSGDVTINAGRLSVTNGGLANVQNQGPGKAGTLRINADLIFLDNKGGITAASTSGEGGNLFLHAQNLQLGHNSAITATASGGSGNGGNITINAGTLVALENSPITANAFKGNGGNIQINTQALFRSPDSAITASSRLGIDGTVQINTLGTNPGNALTILPTTLVDVTRQIAQGCAGAEGNVGKSEFYITGRGGLPPHPGEPLQTEALILRRASQESRGENHSTSSSSKHSEPSTFDPLEQAQGWIINPQGEVELVATPPTTSQSYRSTPATCYAR